MTCFITVSFLVIAISSTMYFYFHTLLRDNIFEQQYILVSEIAEQLHGRIELARHQLSLAATEINTKVLSDPGKLEQILIQASPASMIFDAGFAVIGTDGKIISENLVFTDLTGKDLSFRDYVKEPLQTGKPFISAPFRLSVPPHSPMIAMSIPVRDNNDRIICLFTGYHSLGSDQFLTNLSAERIGTAGYLYLLQDRTILVHPDKNRILEVIAPGRSKGIDKALHGFEGSIDNVNAKGQRLLTSFKKIDNTGWILAANRPYDEAFRPLDKLIMSAAGVSIIGIFLSLFVIWYVTRRLILPLSQLNDHVISTGSATVDYQPIELDTGDEIEQLADAFNTMMNEVHETKQLLKYERDFFSSIIQNAAAPMFVIDHNHKIIFWNSSIAQLTGKSSFQMKGTKQQWTPFYPSKRPVLADLVLDNKQQLANSFYSNPAISTPLESTLIVWPNSSAPVTRRWQSTATIRGSRLSRIPVNASRLTILWKMLTN